jgi:hypothetical protein
MKEINQETIVEGIIAESIQNPITQKEKPELVRITALQTKENESNQNPITPITVRSAIGWTPSKPVVSVPVPVDLGVGSKSYAESAEKTRTTQARLIESFQKKRDERLEEKNDKRDDLRLNSEGDLVEMVLSRSQSAQAGSPSHSDRSSSNSSKDQTITRLIEEDGECQRNHCGRNRRIPEEEVYRTPRSDHYTDAEYDNQALEAWRHQCKKSHDYMPDRDYSASV